MTLKEYYKLFVLGMLMKYPRDLTPPCNAKKKIITLSHRALQEEGGGGKRERRELKRSLNSAILIKASNLVVHL